MDAYLWENCLRPSCLSSGQLAGGHLELVAPVLRPGGLAFAASGRALLAVAHRFQARLGNAALAEVALGGGGASLAERHVVLVRTALVGIASNADPHARVAAENGDLRVERGAGGLAQLGLVELEVDRSR